MLDETAFLSVQSLNLSLGKFALRNIDLSLNQGEYHILMGPSGSGKSSLIKSILGFYRIENGKIILDSRDISNQFPEKRRMGYVPQNYALFPHLNVEKNLRFGMRAQKFPEKEADFL